MIFGWLKKTLHLKSNLTTTRPPGTLSKYGVFLGKEHGANDDGVVKALEERDEK